MTGAFSAHVHAYTIPQEHPQKYEDIQTVMQSEIPTALAGAQCGGWMSNVSVGRQLGSGFIAKVKGAPGREGQPLGNYDRQVDSAMSKRIDTFVFPDNAQGKTTICKPENQSKEITLTVWQDGPNGLPGQYVSRTVPYPLFIDPPCLYGQPGSAVDNGDSTPVDGPHTEEKCTNFCSWLNTFTYEDCREFEPVLVPDGSASSSGDTTGQTNSDGFNTTGNSSEDGNSQQNTSSDGSTFFENTSSADSTFFQNTSSEGSNFFQQNTNQDPVPSLFNPGDAPPGEFISDPSLTPPDSNMPLGPTSWHWSGNALLAQIPGFSDGDSNVTVEPPSFLPFPPDQPPNPPSVPVFPSSDAAVPDFPPPSSSAGDAYSGGSTGLFGGINGGNGDASSAGGGVFGTPFGGTIGTSFGGTIGGGGSSSSAFSVPPGMRIIGWRCKAKAERYTCSNQWVQPGFGNVPAGIAGLLPTVQTGDYPNCRQQCQGQECRCPGPGCAESPLGVQGGDFYKSFYRRYTVDTKRQEMPQAFNDQLKELTGPTAATAFCYGFYDESFDPLSQVTTDRQRKCSIYFPYAPEDGNPFAQSPMGLKRSQMAKGTYAKAEDQIAADEILPTLRNTSFNNQTDLLYTNAGGAISFLSDPVFSTQYARDLSSALLQPDTAIQTASYQISKDQPIAHSGEERATGDATSDALRDNRPFIRWWQLLLTNAHQLLSPPTVYLELSSSLADVLNQLPRQQSGTAPTQNAYPPSQTVEAQLAAKDDLLGLIANALRNLLRIKTEPIPVVVPLGTKLGYEGMRQQWVDYMIQRDARGLPYPKDEILKLIARLEQYANQIDQYAKLRDELPRYISALLDRQQEIFTGINQWVGDNLDRYRAFLENRKARLALASKAQALQAAYATFHDATNFPWCRSGDFTQEIYSNLDPWYPGRPALGGGVPSCDDPSQGLPILCLPRDRDLVLHLTNFRLTNAGVSAPVPQVVPILFTIASPPAAEGDTPNAADIPQLPDLPPVPVFSQAVLDGLPTVEKRDPPPGTLEAPAAFDTARAAKALDRALEIVNGMNESYETFWKNIVPSKETANGECMAWGKEKCTYVETELIQDFTTFVAMPGVHLAESLDTVGKPIDRICDPADHTCSPLRPEHLYPTDGWQIAMPAGQAKTDQGIIEQLRTDARETTIDAGGKIVIAPSTGKPLPYDVNGASDLYPIFHTPQDIDLAPPTP